MRGPIFHRGLLIRSRINVRRAAGKWLDRAAGKESNGETHTLVALSIIVCLLVLNVMVRRPELGALIAQYNLF
jgi:hypothetical protein